MNKSRSFDRAANIYDSTRPLLEPIANYGIPAILDLLGPRAQVLEAGSGTGRISIPLLERGVDLIGCDLSSAMLRRFREKLPAARVTRADASLLPFPTAGFDAVLTVHVMHLIPPWRETLREFKRVIKPGGIYLNVRTWDAVANSTGERIREFWRNWLRANGVDAGHPGVRDHAEFQQELRSLGAELSDVEVVSFNYPFTLSEELDRLAARVYSDTWDVPDPIYQESMKELRAWVMQEYGDLEQEFADEVRFVIHVARFGS